MKKTLMILLLISSFVYADQFNSNIYPVSTNSLDVGTSSLKWRNGYYAGSVLADSLTDGFFSVNDGVITGATNAYWDEAYLKRVNTWTSPLSFSNNTASWALLGLQNLSDPDADRIFFWDNSENAAKWLQVSTGLSLSGTILTTNDSEIDHGTLAGLADDDHLQYWIAQTIRDANYTTTKTLTAGKGVFDNITIDGSTITHDAAIASDWTFRNSDQDKNIEFRVNDGGVDTNVATFVGATQSFQGAGCNVGVTPGYKSFAWQQGMATGPNTICIGSYGGGKGQFAIASADLAIVMGQYGRATSKGCISIGSYNAVSTVSNLSILPGIAIGGYNTLTNDSTIGIGILNTISGNGDIGIGYNNNLSGGGVTSAIGFNLTSTARRANLAGYNFTNSEPNTYKLGIGQQDFGVKDSNCYVYKNLRVGSTVAPSYKLDVNGISNAKNYISTIAIGTSPYACTSTTLNTNLNADLWDGYQFSDYLNQAVKTTSTPTFVELTLSGRTATYVAHYGTGGVLTESSGFFFASSILNAPNLICDNGTISSGDNGNIDSISFNVTSSGDITFDSGGTLALNSANITTDTSTGTKIGTATSQKIGLWNATPVDQPAALTTQLSTITYTEPGTPDYAIQDLTQVTPYGFVSADEAQTLLKVIKNLQDRVAELEARLEEIGIVAPN